MRRAIVAVLLAAAACSTTSPATVAARRTTTTRATTTTAPPVPGACHPDTYEPCRSITPGSLNPAVTQATIAKTICVTGWTTTIRPPQTVTGPLKATAAKAYGYSAFKPALYEGDHLIALELGGNPEGVGSDISNFWDESYTVNGPDGQPAGAGIKDRFENYLRQQVCAGHLTLAVAQQEIAGDWYSAYVAAHRPLGTASTTDD